MIDDETSNEEDPRILEESSPPADAPTEASFVDLGFTPHLQDSSDNNAAMLDSSSEAVAPSPVVMRVSPAPSECGQSVQPDIETCSKKELEVTSFFNCRLIEHTPQRLVDSYGLKLSDVASMRQQLRRLASYELPAWPSETGLDVGSSGGQGSLAGKITDFIKKDDALYHSILRYEVSCCVYRPSGKLISMMTHPHKLLPKLSP